VRITVLVPSIPPRREMLARALISVARQRRPADAIVTAIDVDRAGAPACRDTALAMARTDWVAPLDDDDELRPYHLGALAAAAAETGADLVYPWYDVHGGADPHAEFEGQPWDSAKPHQVPITWLARTALILDAGGFARDWDPTQGTDPGTDPLGHRAGEDYRLILRLAAAGARIVHLHRRTWIWHHHLGNTMGLPTRW
jgi:glycosyltransferase involved in cell wall biosynthesis